MINAEYYHALRARFSPDKVKLVLLFESPPEGGNYFYDCDGRTSEPLFKAIMKLFGWSPETKFEGLNLLRNAGIVLLDATYVQVNHMSGTQRRNIMRDGYESLRSRLPDAPILIGMVGVLDAVGSLLERDGFQVLNNGVRIPFPAMGQQHRFHELASDVLQLGEE